MANLIYYKNEKEVFKTAFEKKISIKEAEIIFKKLCRHYKLGDVFLKWTSGCRRPKAFSDWKVLLNVDNNTIGILCHEVAHIKHHRKYCKGGHNKKHWKIMKGMIDYCEKKNWFEDELAKRLAPKPIKIELTKDEIKIREIIRLQDNCKRYQTKIKRYGNKLKKAQKKIVRLSKRIVMGNLSFLYSQGVAEYSKGVEVYKSF